MDRFLYIIPPLKEESIYEVYIDDYSNHIDTVYNYFKMKNHDINNWLDGVLLNDYLVITVNSHELLIYFSQNINKNQIKAAKKVLEKYVNMNMYFGMLDVEGGFLLMSKINSFNELRQLLKNYMKESEGKQYKITKSNKKD